MDDKQQLKGQAKLHEGVLRANLCTNCGACVNLCPYNVSYRDKIIPMDSCNREDGCRCVEFCPRTPVDLEALQKKLFDPNDLTPEIGAFKGLYITRATDKKIRAVSQHGGTVTSLIALALQEGIIDAAVLAEEGTEYLPHGVMVTDFAEAPKQAKSKFVVSPTVAKFNEVTKHESRNIGVVATPCQALALAKMRLKPVPEKDNNIDKLRLAIGLFCGWALSWDHLKQILADKFESKHVSVLGMDIPPSKYHRMEVYTSEGTVNITLDEILPCVRESCDYCFDMTAEFCDISVGSARTEGGWEDAKGWNQVIVRSDMGQELIELARLKGILEFREVPKGNLEKLKKASMNKKSYALKRLIELSGSSEDLIYLDGEDPVLSKIIN